jgi:DNA repair and recombination RAD54-like protein
MKWVSERRARRAVRRGPCAGRVAHIERFSLSLRLQTITLIWTLLRSGPNGAPTVKKAVVVCPSSLTGNWRREFNKWLVGTEAHPASRHALELTFSPGRRRRTAQGSHRLQPIELSTEKKAAEQADAVRSFTNSAVFPVLIVGYELLRKHVKALADVRDLLLVCDEGHRHVRVLMPRRRR